MLFLGFRISFPFLDLHVLKRDINFEGGKKSWIMKEAYY
jgi:hypothetical protein